MDTNDPGEAGEFLEVTAQLENPTGTALSADLELVVGHDPTVEDTASSTVGAGSTQTITMGYETIPVGQDVTFPVRVETDADADEVTVQVMAGEN